MKEVVLVACLFVVALWIATWWMLGERLDAGFGRALQPRVPAEGLAVEAAARN